MFSKTIATAAAFSALMATGAQAENLLASNPEGFLDVFFEAGYPAQLTEDAVGDPLIEFRLRGETESMFFYDCDNNKDCLSLQLYSGYMLDKAPSLEAINEWNSGDRRFTRAYLSEDGAARIEMDIATGADGISRRDFEDLLELWIDRLAGYEEFIGW